MFSISLLPRNCLHPSLSFFTDFQNPTLLLATSPCLITSQLPFPPKSLPNLKPHPLCGLTKAKVGPFLSGYGIKCHQWQLGQEPTVVVPVVHAYLPLAQTWSSPPFVQTMKHHKLPPPSCETPGRASAVIASGCSSVRVLGSRPRKRGSGSASRTTPPLG